MTLRLSLPLCFLVLAGGAARAQITEDFNQPATVSDGSTLGACGQLTARLAGSGSINVSGGGTAVFNTASVPDAAMLCSSQPLPATYKVTVRVHNVNYHKAAVENGVTALAIANVAPTPSTEADWLPKRLVGVEIDSKPYFTDDSSIFVNYWDAAWDMYTWDGVSWGKGDPAWAPYFPIKSSYEVTIEKTASDYQITVRGDGVLLAQTSVPVSSVMPSSGDYLVIGDRLTDFFSGSMELESVTMPGPAGCNPSDAGPPAPSPDGGPPEFPTPDGGTGAWPDGLFSADSGIPYKPRPSEPSACDCNVGSSAAPGLGSLGLLPVLLLLLLLRSRGRAG